MTRTRHDRGALADRLEAIGVMSAQGWTLSAAPTADGRVASVIPVNVLVPAAVFTPSTGEVGFVAGYTTKNTDVARSATGSPPG
ncbi:MAG: hypothetical protein WAR57_13230 [Candidatus Phosphoribacter sp.]|nr:hypothetical protein [Actinomycetales bacterium]